MTDEVVAGLVIKKQTPPPKKTVAAVIAADKKILLVKRGTDPFKDHWVLPGGIINDGESDEDAVKREVTEETGLSITPSYFGNYDESFPEYNWSAIVTVFTGDAADVKKATIGSKEEIVELQWFPFHEVHDLHVGFDHQRIISDFITEQ